MGGVTNFYYMELSRTLVCIRLSSFDIHANQKSLDKKVISATKILKLHLQSSHRLSSVNRD